MTGPRYAEHNRNVVERHGERMVDAFLLAMLRHHLDGDADKIEDVIRFCLRTASLEQLLILLKYMGARHDVLLDEFMADAWDDDTVLEARLEFGPVWIRDGEVRIEGLPLPETVVQALSDKRELTIGDIIEHPYMPGDLRVSGLVQTGRLLVFRVGTPNEAAGPD